MIFAAEGDSEVSVPEFDLIVIGSGPAGQKGAIAAAKTHKRVAIIDRTTMIGGVCVHTGTIPSKTVREAIFQLTGFAVKALYGNGFRKRGDISLQDVSFRVNAVISRETEVIRAQLKRNGIAIHEGRALFLDPHTVEVESEEGRTRLKSEKILLPAALDQHTVRKFHSTTIELWTQTIFRLWVVCRRKSSSLVPESWAWSTHRSWRPWVVKSS